MSKNNQYTVVCMKGSKVIDRLVVCATDEYDVVQEVQSKIPAMRHPTARIYINGIPASRRLMGQSEVKIEAEPLEPLPV